MEEYDETDLKITLLTYIRSMKYIEQDELYQAYNSICKRLEITHEPSMDNLNTVISTINNQIQQQGFKIERKNHEITGSLYFIFINTSIDPIIKQCSSYQIPELSTIKLLIEDLIDNSDYKLNRVAAHQRINHSLKKPLAECSALVDRLIDDGWFISTLDDNLILSIKTLCELKQSLIDSFEDKLLICKQCKEIVTIGYKLEHDSFHRKCFDVYSRNNNLSIDESNLIKVGPDPTTI